MKQPKHVCYLSLHSMLDLHEVYCPHAHVAKARQAPQAPQA